MATNKNDFIKQFTYDRYLGKKDIGFRIPNDLSLNETWQDILNFRKQRSLSFSFEDQSQHAFWYLLTPALQKKIYEIDSNGKDSLYSMVKKDIEHELVRDSLIEESLYSSVIEGAFSTIKRLRELVEEKKKPRDINDQMVLNNHKAMQFIFEAKHEKLSIPFILKLHKLVTDKTLDVEDQEFTGRFRNGPVYIKDKRDRVIYTPPPAKTVPGSMEKLVDWVNEEEEAAFIHPIIKASFIHFYLVYVHPFFDGNGRTARALFYYYLIKHGYDFFKYFSISVVVQKTKAQYYKAIKDVEDYEADLTYFLLYMADTIGESIEQVKNRIIHRYHRDLVFGRLKEKGIFINSRQEKFLRKFLIRDVAVMTIQDYQKIHSVVYETARRDLEDLVERGILLKSKHRRKFFFRPNYDF